jgi:nicotinamidase-related amidase
MQALLVVDVQNEFSGKGLRAVPNHEEALRRIARHVEEAREAGRPIAWVQHFNKPHESKAFVPGTWGSQLSSFHQARFSGRVEERCAGKGGALLPEASRSPNRRSRPNDSDGAYLEGVAV